TTSIPLISQATGAPPTRRSVDLAFNPYSGRLYGYYGGTFAKVIVIDTNTGIVDDVTYPGGQIGQTLGSLFFDAFGRLYAYGRPNNGNLQNTLFELDTLSGVVSVITTGPNANGTDGCSCPYSVELQKKVLTQDTIPCSLVEYRFIVANASGTIQTGLDLTDQLPSGLYFHSLVSNTFGGTLQSQTGDTVVSLTNLTVPLGVDSFSVMVYVDTLSTGVFQNQAVLSNLPLALGISTLSDDPITLETGDSTELLVNPVLVDLPNQEVEICTGDSIVLDASQYSGVFYEWSDGSSGSSLTVTQGGTYWVVAHGCEIVFDTIVVIENPLPPVAASPDTSFCEGDTILLQASGAENYTWSPVAFLDDPNAAAPLAFPTDTSWVWVEGVDSLGCRQSDSILLTVWPLPTVEAGMDFGLCTYETDTLGSLANPPGNYQWTPATGLATPNQSRSQFQPFAVGSFLYTLTATSNQGCTASDEIYVTVHDVQLVGVGQDLTCQGDSSGSIRAEMLVGQGPFNFTLEDSLGNVVSTGVQISSIAEFTGLFPGEYRLSAFGNNGCVEDTFITLNEPPTLGLQNLEQVNVDCFGNQSGLVRIAGTGGTPDYLYSIDGQNFGPDSIFTGLGAFQYTLIVQDANLCQDTLTVDIATPTGLTGLILESRNVDCFGGNSGSITLGGSGGTGPYQWSLDGSNFVPSDQFPGLTAGNYVAWVRDDNGCLASTSLLLNEPPPLVATVEFLRGVDCFGNQNGAIEVGATGGSGAYTYAIDGLTYGPDNFFDGLTAGAYTLWVRDDSLCVATVDTLITQPDLLELSLDKVRDVDCFGNATGQIDATAIGGVGPYQFAVDPGAFQFGDSFDSLAAGTYLIRVQDDSLCLDSMAMQINEPDPLALSISTQANVDCFGDSSAWLKLLAEGGTPAYQFSLDDMPFQTADSMGGLAAGSYQVVLQDDSACTDTLTTTITQPDSLILVLDQLRGVDCHGNATGALRISGAGGVPAYGFQLDGQAVQATGDFFDLVAGAYLVSIEDDSNCVSTQTYEIAEPAALGIDVAVNDVACFGDRTGSAIASVEGGTMPYRYLWDSEPTQEDSAAQNLPMGTYVILVRDDSACTISDTVTVSEPPPLVLSWESSSARKSFCDWPNGQAEVSALGGTPPYAFLWDSEPPRFEALASDIFGDSLTAVVSDALGCQDSVTGFIPRIEPPVASFSTFPNYLDSIFESDQPLLFINQSQRGIGFEWDFGDGNGWSVADNPRYEYAEPGDYWVQLVAMDSNLTCPADTMILVRVLPNGRIYFPNAFSPNGDGANDFFRLAGEGILRFELEIFDRWGRSIALIPWMEPGWDGRLSNGRPAPEGVYVYRARYTFFDGRTADRGGTITLVR
ncbi:MAG: gliding motility-associated C-terminal domain-containing protein, partial [Bacteroidota bacterium]